MLTRERITNPRSVREWLGVEPGDRIEFTEEEKCRDET